MHPTPSQNWATAALDFARELAADRERSAASRVCRDFLGERCLEYSIHKVEGKVRKALVGFPFLALSLSLITIPI